MVVEDGGSMTRFADKKESLNCGTAVEVER